MRGTVPVVWQWKWSRAVLAFSIRPSVACGAHPFFSFDFLSRNCASVNSILAGGPAPSVGTIPRLCPILGGSSLEPLKNGLSSHSLQRFCSLRIVMSKHQALADHEAAPLNVNCGLASYNSGIFKLE